MIRSDNHFIEYLRENGPSTPSEIGTDGASYEARRTGLAKRARTSGTSKAVWYLPDEHDMRDVVRKLLEVDPGLLDSRLQDVSSKFSRLGPEFLQAWRSVRSEYDVHTPLEYPPDGTSHDGTTCPFCGDEVYRLPSHLPGCPDKP